MKKSIYTAVAVILTFPLHAQNLLVNSDAESLPRGTGWTVLSQGALSCLLVPTNNMVNWTMKPNGTANYPYDHTTGANGGTVFFAGCDTYFSGPFELEQVIDVSNDSASIDAGNQLYDFSGFMQTPVSNQTDMGRYIVDFMNSANAVLGASYRSDWQSNFDGSGTGWTQYSNTRTAPVGTRKVRIKLQAQIHINQPAINVYFDDITFSKTTVVPVGLVSFTAKANNSNIYLHWDVATAADYTTFTVERSTDATHFSPIKALTATGAGNYQFVDNTIDAGAEKYFYRLRLKNAAGKISYSKIAVAATNGIQSFSLYPNPANDIVILKGLPAPGKISVMDYKGMTVLQKAATTSSITLDITRLTSGMYTVRFMSEGNSITKKLLIQHR